jgi:hypothetical protein
VIETDHVLFFDVVRRAGVDPAISHGLPPHCMGALKLASGATDYSAAMTCVS